jgi:hypothetical protein
MYAGLTFCGRLPAGLQAPGRRASDPEVGDHRSQGAVVGNKHHVSRLEVPVNEPLRMDGCEPLRHLCEERERLTG